MVDMAATLVHHIGDQDGGGTGACNRLAVVDGSSNKISAA